jgi:metal-sulfur cluster biosynthetic enzyme
VTASRADVEGALAEVLDPEYPVGLVDLGLIRGVDLEAGTATVRVVYCSLGCPCIDLIQEDIVERLLRVPGIERVEIVELFEPWTRDDITRKGLTLLRRAGVA